MAWDALPHLGNLTLTLPLGGAIAAWLLAAREWRAAVVWVLAMGAALAVVGASKVAFLGWGTGIPALGFKAFSGHAAGVATVYPVLLYLALRCLRPVAPWLGAVLGVVLGAIVAFALVATAEHTVAEAASGWTIGCVASGTTIRHARTTRRPPVSLGLASSLFAFATASWAMQEAHVGYWMIKVALALSGNTRPFQWDSCS